MQFYETWAFVGRKEKNCDPDDARRGDCSDHTAIDPDTWLVVSLVVGKRTAEAVSAVAEDFRRRTGGRVMRLITSDEYPAYTDAIREAHGQQVVPPRTGRPGRPRKPYTVVPPAVTYATVHKRRENGRVVRVSTRVVFGTLVAVALALAVSAVSRVVNTCFVERHNGTDRSRCSRKARKTYAFSKDWAAHRAATMFSHFSYNFCWPVRTLRVRGRWAVAEANARDGRGSDRSCVVAQRMADLSRRTTQIGHHPILRKTTYLCRTAFRPSRLAWVARFPGVFGECRDPVACPEGRF